MFPLDPWNSGDPIRADHLNQVVEALRGIDQFFHSGIESFSTLGGTAYHLPEAPPPPPRFITAKITAAAGGGCAYYAKSYDGDSSNYSVSMSEGTLGELAEEADVVLLDLSRVNELSSLPLVGLITDARVVAEAGSYTVAVMPPPAIKQFRWNSTTKVIEASFLPS